MECEIIEPELCTFYFGDPEPALRAAIERHLADCTSCVREFLRIKRSVEVAAGGYDVPSPQARQRLFTAAEEALSHRRQQRLRGKVGICVSVSAGAIAIALLLHLVSHPSRTQTPAVDTARPVAQSVRFL
jgi:hypothetical protein